MSNGKKYQPKSENEIKILKLLYSKAPNSLTYIRIVSELDIPEDKVKTTLDRLVSEDLLTTELEETNRRELIKKVNEKRKSYYIKKMGEDYPFEEFITVNGRTLSRVFDGGKLAAEDLNSVIETMKHYTDGVNDHIRKEVRKEASKIYIQMITIFGVFVSVFAIIVISTDKMLRFSPDVLNKGWLSLLGQSIALFLPVGLVIGGLVCLVIWSSRK